MKNYSRYTHFDYVPLPGGDKSVDEPWRIAVSYIYKYFGDNFDICSIPHFRIIEKKKLVLVKEAIENKINTPLSSGAGRLFDAVSALLGLCTNARFDSEAPMRLESVINDKTDDFYPFIIGETVNFSDTFKAIIDDLRHETISVISAKFHNTIARIIFNISSQIRKKESIDTGLLSGGVFQNKYLLEKSYYLLENNGFRVFTNNIVPANDGGISLGQLVIAKKQ